MTWEERVTMVKAAQVMMEEAVEMVGMAVEHTQFEAHTAAYFMGNVQNFIRANFQPGNLDELIEDLEKEVEK